MGRFPPLLWLLLLGLLLLPTAAGRVLLDLAGGLLITLLALPVISHVSKPSTHTECCQQIESLGSSYKRSNICCVVNVQLVLDAIELRYNLWYPWPMLAGTFGQGWCEALSLLSMP